MKFSDDGFQFAFLQGRFVAFGQHGEAMAVLADESIDKIIFIDPADETNGKAIGTENLKGVAETAAWLRGVTLR